MIQGIVLQTSPSSLFLIIWSVHACVFYSNYRATWNESWKLSFLQTLLWDLLLYHLACLSPFPVAVTKCLRLGTSQRSEVYLAHSFGNWKSKIEWLHLFSSRNTCEELTIWEIWAVTEFKECLRELCNSPPNDRSST